MNRRKNWTDMRFVVVITTILIWLGLALLVGDILTKWVD